MLKRNISAGSSQGSWDEQKLSSNLNHIDYLLGKKNDPPVPVLQYVKEKAPDLHLK